MASTSSLISSLTPSSNFAFCPRTISQIPSLTQTVSFPLFNRTGPYPSPRLTANVQSLEFSGSFFEGGFQSEDDPTSPPGSGLTAVEEKEDPPCPPGLRQYETMAVLRPDMSEDERLTLTQKYEELLIAGGGMYVEVFNRGVIPLAYGIQKKNKAGESNTYLDGIYLLFTYFTKPESLEILEANLKADDNVIRSMSFKIRKRKY
ncbi:30S ribosomal protein S6 alpha [Pyrus ussuriensis x Pyrus communis]|uniref:30S ribosomal protein S6 alpha n=1 Tax=Pyrus ussuriensis x Pyrus communis TaxID=2448454 RepID=A0A5N5I1E7_9ROSA|nr:30S ribosomal protein S6 alpha, chloroplastic [Pyrus x bretschneideri]KAB2632943.1 30S ribosomal protein S6 alpha [Pyrus ussuriensis x Pyrus communis]